MRRRLAGNFPVRQKQCRSGCCFTHFMPTFREHCPGGKLVCDIAFFYGLTRAEDRELVRTAHQSDGPGKDSSDQLASRCD